ncbi:50S ribosomal protein L39e [Candidatus Hecatella orcuttiae]|uniref:50S ribosomal protein L39e n=1 Tax=Candidatus Hecatella orcuttiae TaxID=1935119 RepID=UPI00286827FC|nr:50S ribosomal protein L39e [Candidatus Hecatella orcuttiae]
MTSRKVFPKKLRLSKELKAAKPVPAWIMAKTKGKVRRSPARRHWRRTKIKI